MQRIFEGMLHATFIPGRGLSAIGPTRIKDEDKQLVKGPTRISDGPQLQAGPFIIPLAALKEGYQIHLTHKKTRESRLAFDMASWAVDSIWQMSQKRAWDSTTFSHWKAGPRSATAPFAKDGKSLWARDYVSIGMGQTIFNKTGKDQWLYPKFKQSDGTHDVNVGGYWVSAPGLPGNIRGVGGVLIPDNQVWGVPFFTGKKPIAKFKRPGTYEEWGIYCLISYDKFLFTFKKIDKAWYLDIWDWIKTLVAKIIEFVSDVIDFIKDMVACPLARQYLDKLSALAAQSTHVLTIEERKDLLKFLQKGDPALTYDSLADIETGAQSDAIKAVADRVLTKVCGPPPKTLQPPPPKEPEPVWYKNPWVWGGLAITSVAGFAGWRLWSRRRA